MTSSSRSADTGLTFIDIFCGAGGSSLGLTAAGYSLTLAANHWQRAIETHSTNFAWAEHLCADVNNYDMRRLPPARVLWASPLCTESSPAGGKAKKRGSSRMAQLELLTDEQAEERRRIEAAGWERTRATAYDVIRAAEVWAYDAVLIENVIEFATDWPLFWWWLEGMGRLGYRWHIVCVNSAHIGAEDNPYAPQWRDRMYIVLLREGIRMPDLEPRPLAHCFECGEDVAARQSWKDTAQTRAMGKIGKYREQYVYTCPNTARRHASLIVEPYVLAAASAIDWSDLGQRIADRNRPLKPNTIRRIREGLRIVTEVPATVAQPAGTDPGSSMLVQVGGNKRNASSTTLPMPTRVTRDTDALVAAPFIAELRGGGSSARPAVHPMATVTAGGNHHGLVTPPFVVKNYGGNCRPEHTVVPIDGPLSTITVRDHHALVIPYRKGKAKTTADPLHTVATRDSAALVQSAIDVDDCHYRMLKPREHLRAQRFPDSYIVTGTGQEQTKQAGNAVSANVAQWLGARVAAVL